MKHTFTYTNQLEESSEYTVTIPDFKSIYQTDIEIVQKLIDESSDPDFLEAALEILDGLQHFNDVLNNTDLSIIEEAPTVLFLVLDKKVLDPGKQPTVRTKRPKTIIKDGIREQLQSSKIRMFSKQELGRNSFDLGLLGDK